MHDREQPDVSRAGEVAQRLDEGPLPVDLLMELLLVEGLGFDHGLDAQLIEVRPGRAVRLGRAWKVGVESS